MSGTPSDLPPAGTYELDPVGSTISFTTRHMFGLAGVNGTFTLHDGTITVPTEDAESSDLEVGLRIDAASFDTGTARRDTHVRSKDFLDTDAHDFIEFNASSPASTFDGSTVEGTLRVAGNEGPLRVDIHEFSETSDGIRVKGSTTVNRYDFGVTKMKGMAGRDLKMQIDLAASRSQ